MANYKTSADNTADDGSSHKLCVVEGTCVYIYIVSTKHHSKKSRVAKVGFNSRGGGALSRESFTKYF